MIVFVLMVEFANGVFATTSYKSRSVCTKPFSSFAGTNVKARLALRADPEFVIVKVRLTLLFTQPIALLVPVFLKTVVAPGAVPAEILSPMPPNASAKVLSVRVV